MKPPDSSPSAGRKVVLATLLAFALLAGIVLPFQHRDVGTGLPAAAPAGVARTGAPPGLDATARLRARAGRKPAAEQIVARKLALFARKHRRIVHEIGAKYHLAVPTEVDRFFEAVEAGDWEKIHAIFHSLRGGDQQGPGNGPGSEDLRRFWRPILEAFGAAEQVHEWPAQLLMDYGNSILDSLKPGMAYAGGTDPGCFIPTMLNETTDGEQHIVFTQK